MNATINLNGNSKAETQPLVCDRPVFPDFPGNHNHPGLPHIATREETSLNPVRTPPPSGRRPGKKLLLAILVAIAIVVCLLLIRSRTYRQLAITTSQMAVPTVSTTLPQAEPANVEIK